MQVEEHVVMNLASWIILLIVLVIVGLAIKATFFKKKSRGGCCDTGDAPSKSAKHACCENKSEQTDDAHADCDGSEYEIKLASGACGSCTLCRDSAVTRNAVVPIVKPIE